MNRRLRLIGILALVAMFSAPAVFAADTVVLKLGNIQAPTQSASLACERMAKLVFERSNGRLKIEFFPASQLGNAITQIEGVMMGTQDMFQDAAEWMSQFEKDYNILAMAFAFRDQNHLQAFFNSPLNVEIKERLRKDRGIRIIAENWNRAPRDLVSKKPVNSPADLQGIKMRVPEIEMYLLVWKAMGTQPTQVAWGETYLALMQGLVDAMEGPFDTLLSMKFFEAAQNISMTHHLISASSVSHQRREIQQAAQGPPGHPGGIGQGGRGLLHPDGHRKHDERPQGDGVQGCQVHRGRPQAVPGQGGAAGEGARRQGQMEPGPLSEDSGAEVG